MIIVTGTKRSGTSMWMQILKAADFPIIGRAFSKDWEDTIKDANPEGFYESPLRHGINFQTNPLPNSDLYLHPQQTQTIAVKVFIPGLVRTDYAFLHRVIACMRPWREYAASLNRLYAMERENRTIPEDGHLEFIHPVLEWWDENFSLVRDFIMRQFPLHVIPYQMVLRDPAHHITETLTWVNGGPLERDKLQAAIDVVKPRLSQYTGSQPEVDMGDLELPKQAPDVFDELCHRLVNRLPLDTEFIDRMNDLHDELEPVIQDTRKQLMKERRDLVRKRMERKKDARQSEGQTEGQAGPTQSAS